MKWGATYSSPNDSSRSGDNDDGNDYASSRDRALFTQIEPGDVPGSRSSLKSSPERRPGIMLLTQIESPATSRDRAPHSN